MMPAVLLNVVLVLVLESIGNMTVSQSDVEGGAGKTSLADKLP